MKLRAKIVIVIFGLMGILYMLVVAALLPELTGTRLRARQEAGRAAADSMAAVLDLLLPPERVRLLNDVSGLRKVPGLSTWVVTDDHERVRAWSFTHPPPLRLDEELRATLHLDITVPLLPDRPDSGPWTLHVAYPAANLALDRELWTLFITMLLGTMMLGVAVYGMTLRLVIQPVERLAAASRAAVDGRGMLSKVPATDRADEIGALVRAYNAMIDEVNDLRTNLEHRVQAAVADLEQAQKKLILSERLSTAGKLAAGVAHEINNPLGGMLNAARSLRKKAAVESRESEYLEMIEEGLGRVQGIVATMLQFARPATQRVSVNLAELFDGALLFCQHRLKKVGVELVREFPQQGQAQVYVLGNRAELGQVLLNLVVNAIDALEATHGPRRITLSVREENGQAQASVHDTGHGMSAETRAQAGQLFFSTKGEGRGTGLGLAIVKHILSEHAGVLDIDCESGRGTTMTVKLPLESTPPALQRPSDESAEPLASHDTPQAL